MWTRKFPIIRTWLVWSRGFNNFLWLWIKSSSHVTDHIVIPLPFFLHEKTNPSLRGIGWNLLPAVTVTSCNRIFLRLESLSELWPIKGPINGYSSCSYSHSTSCHWWWANVWSKLSQVGIMRTAILGSFGWIGFSKIALSYIQILHCSNALMILL